LPPEYFARVIEYAVRSLMVAGFADIVLIGDGGQNQAPQKSHMTEPDKIARQTRFECANPILCVTNMARSVQYYVEALGFTNASWGTDDFSLVTRDDAGIYLARGGQGNPGTWAWIGVEDVAALHEEFKATGAIIASPPQSHPWALEMRVADPDGHVLRFGSDPQEHE
jgi:predicted enzyme related to lactoylglutathione lyase